MTRVKIITATVLTLSFAFFVSKQFLKTHSLNTLPLIAITQIVEHPALDDERIGIIFALNKAGLIDGKNIKIVYQCAQGNQATAIQIAQHFAGIKPKVVIAISTPSAQAVIASCKDAGIPVVFAAITDPIAAKLVKTLEARSEAITGVVDFVPIPDRVKFISSLFPKAKRIGVIYNSSEVNSSTIVKKMKSYVQGSVIEIIEAIAIKSNDVSQALNSLCNKVDVLYIPNDNTAISAIATIVQWGRDHKIPVLTTDPSLINTGIKASDGYSHKKMGEAAGDQVIQILRGKFAGDIPVKTEHTLETLIN